MKKSEKDLFGRAFADADFRKRLLADPDGVIDGDGYEIPADLRVRIKDAAGKTPEALKEAIESAARDGGVGG